jgi:hypothetical protein
MFKSSMLFAKHLAARAIPYAMPDLLITPDGGHMVDELGHRRYVGGNWDHVAEGSFNFLVGQGMQPDHVLLDIACGAFRLGSRAIPYLDPGNYLGLDKEAGLVDAGIKHELGSELIEDRRPEIVISDQFEFRKFSRQPDFAVAYSLFTHLTPDAIDLCLQNLAGFIKPGTVFFSTFQRRSPFWRNPSKSNSFASFRYSTEEMLEFGQRNGFCAEYLGEWMPEAVQKVVRYHLASQSPVVDRMGLERA